MQIRDTPHAIAGGVAIGVFVGFMPILAIKTVLAIMVAWLLRCSKIAAAVAVSFHDLLWLLWPLILLWQYKIGFLVWYSPHHLPKKIKFQHPSIEHLMLDWHNFDWQKFEHVIWPTFIGSVIMAIPVSLLFYFVTLRIVSRYQAKVRAKAATESINSSAS